MTEKIKNIVQFLLTVFLCQQNSLAQGIQTVFTENFSGPGIHIDNGQKLIWGSGQNSDKSFRLSTRTDTAGLSFPCLSLTDSSMKYWLYTNPKGLKTLSSIDFSFPSFARQNKTISIEFDAIWDVLNGFGENGRLVCTLLDSLPVGGVPSNAIDQLQLRNPYGKPMYNIRIRNALPIPSDPVNRSGGLMMYGSGTDSDPKFEVYQSAAVPTEKWWLPGFSTQPFNPVLGETGTPGSASPYPLSPTQKDPAKVMASTKLWRHFTWILKPERMELWYRNSNQDSSQNQRFFFMETPYDSLGDAYVVAKINQAHGSSLTSPPRYYSWYSSFNGVRFYFSGRNQNYLTNIRLRLIPEIQTEVVSKDLGTQFTVYPNPNSGRFIVKIPPSDGDVEVRIYGMASEQLVYKKIYGSQFSQNWEPEKSLPKGIYFLQVKTATKVSIQKLVCE